MTSERAASSRAKLDGTVQKPRAVGAGARVAVFAPASPGSEARAAAGMAELQRLGFSAQRPVPQPPDGYFAAGTELRRTELLKLLRSAEIQALIGLRGGYGSNYLLDDRLEAAADAPKVLLGYSDLTWLQIFLWQRRRWVTLYGPMVAAGFDGGAGAAGGYDQQSLMAALSGKSAQWNIPLRGQAVVTGVAEGRLLGGAMTMVEATLGTPWELDTHGAILILEDRAMKPYQVDRVLIHFLQAGKLKDVKGIVLGDFPECEPTVTGSPTVRDVVARVLEPLGIPIVFGAPVGHTLRPMLTVPLGVMARLHAKGEGTLEILEAAVTP